MAINEADRDVMFEITEAIGIIAAYPTGWQKELNLVSWNGGAPKYDIRDWDPEHEHMSRGVTLHEKEMRLMLDMLRRRRPPRNHIKRQEAPEESEVMEKIAEEKAQE
ncbi:MAG: hypothetical protein GX663_08095 [Clostridiales bacterium]|nr:hypothetical protein [Clostridiales bacterium]